MQMLSHPSREFFAQRINFGWLKRWPVEWIFQPPLIPGPLPPQIWASRRTLRSSFAATMSLNVLPGPRKRIVPTKSRRGLIKLIIIVSPTLVLLYFTFFHRLDVGSSQDAPPEAQPLWKRAAAHAAATAQDFTEGLLKRTAPNVPPVEQPPLSPALPAPVEPASPAEPVAATVPTLQNEKSAAGASLEKASSVEPPVAAVAKKRFCDGASLASPCVFDIGLNNGQDTDLYLRDPNSRVVAVEANPTLIEAAKHRFPDALSSARLHLVSVGLTNKKPLPGSANPTITFWLNTKEDKFGSFVETLGCRTGTGQEVPAGDHSNCRQMEISTRTCRDLVREYGRPTYMKIDIEGMDRACFRSLGSLPLSERPAYLSVENVFAWDIDELAGLGYKRFKIVNQLDLELNALENPSMRGNSGPWGDKAVDQFLGREWHTAKEAKKRLPLPVIQTIPDGRKVTAWYDLHAAM